MKKNLLKMVAIFLCATVLFSSCASSTLIMSNVDGADVYLDGEYVGKTPHKMSDTKIVGAVTQVRLEEEGYETFNASIARNEQVDIGAVIGGIFFLFPFLWTMKYKKQHNYVMRPVEDDKDTD